MCELLQNGEQSGERTQAANSLSALLSGGSRKKAEVQLIRSSVPVLTLILTLCMLRPEQAASKIVVTFNCKFAFMVNCELLL